MKKLSAIAVESIRFGSETSRKVFVGARFPRPFGSAERPCPYRRSCGHIVSSLTVFVEDA